MSSDQTNLSSETSQSELAEEAAAAVEGPENLREILKRQPYVVVERMTAEQEKSKNRPVLHLTSPDRAHRKGTLCGKRFDTATHIPLESWGKPDRDWCRNCMYLTRNSVKNKLKKQVEEYRKAPAKTDGETPMSQPPAPADSPVLTPAADPVSKKASKRKENRAASADQS